MFCAGKPEAGHSASGGVPQVLVADIPVCPASKLLAGFAAMTILAHAQLGIYLSLLLWPFRDNTVGPCWNISQLPQMELVWSCCTCHTGLSDPELLFHLLWELLYTHRLQARLETWEVWGQTLPVKMRQKIGWVPHFFSMSWVTRSSTPLTSGTILFIPFLLLLKSSYYFLHPLPVPCPAECLRF